MSDVPRESEETEGNQQILDDAVQKIASGPMVTKYMLLMESVGDDGDRNLEVVSSDHCYEWDQLGMMDSHRLFLQSRQVQYRIEGD